MFRSFLVAATMASMLSMTPAHAQARQDFDLVNRTGYQINEIYVSSSQSQNWGRDLLGQNVLPNGRSFHVSFSANTRECNWDIKVIYDDGDQSEFRRVNLCQVSKLNLFWDRQRNTTRAVPG